LSAVIYNAGNLTDTLPPVTPASIAATATFSGGWVANVSWPAVSGATAYEVFASTGGGAFTITGTTTSNAFTHTGLAANTTYLYQVRAMNAAGRSGFTALDPATTIAFTDTNLTNAIAIKAAHLNELRAAANAFRAAAVLPPLTFTDPTLTANVTTIKAVHLQEVRAAIDAARDTLGLPLAWSATSPYSGGFIDGDDVMSLRDLVK
jgi:chitodextrinase